MQTPMNRIVRALPIAALTAAALSVSVNAHARDMRIWNIHPEGYPNTIALEQFVNEVEEKTDGAITMKLYNGGVLGSQPDAIEQVRLGAIDVGQFSLGPMGQVVPETNVVSLPFIFSGIPQMYELMDGEVGAALAEGMQKKGLIPLGWYDAGARSMYNSQHPVNTPADVEGLKVRVMNNDLFVGMIESMGGNATPMAFAEVYQSLKTGVVDGAENNPPSYESTNHFEVAQYYSLTEHLIIPECLCMSKMTWDRLDDAQKDIVMAAGKASAEAQRQLWQEREAESMKIVQEGGTEVNEVADKAPFQDAMAPVYDQFLNDNPELADLVSMMRETD